MPGFFIILMIALYSSLTAATVLVVGGAGFIGSHVNKKLVQMGYETIVLDNLSHGDRRNVKNSILIEGDINDRQLLDQVFSTYAIDAVMDFAAFIEVNESVIDPMKYYYNNVCGTINLLQAMLRHKVNVLVFSSTAAVYGTMDRCSVDEETPCHPINPYGRSKLMVESILKDLDSAYGFRFCALRYFNAAGGDPEGILKNYKMKALNFIPIVLKSLEDPSCPVTIFGNDYPTEDGTCIRDYIHVEDLATAHIAAMEHLFSGAPSDSYNIGTGVGRSVREVIEAVERVTGQQVQTIDGQRRPGDPPRVVANSEKAERELDWKPRFSSLDTLVRDAWIALQSAD